MTKVNGGNGGSGGSSGSASFGRTYLICSFDTRHEGFKVEKTLINHHDPESVLESMAKEAQNIDERLFLFQLVRVVQGIRDVQNIWTLPRLTTTTTTTPTTAPTPSPSPSSSPTTVPASKVAPTLKVAPVAAPSVDKLA